MIAKYLGYLMVNSGVNSYFYIGMLTLQILQLFFMLIGYESMNIARDVFLLSILGTVPLSIILLFLELAFIILILWGFVMFKRQYKKKMKAKSDIFILVTKIISYLVIMFKTILILPLNYNVLNAYNQSSSENVDIALCSIIYLTYLTTILPITFTSHFNKFSIKVNVITYPFVFNIVSLIHLYWHIFAIGYIFSKASLPYINAIFLILSCVIIFWNSPAHYKDNKIVIYLYSLIVSLFTVSIANNIMNENS